MVQKMVVCGNTETHTGQFHTYLYDRFVLFCRFEAAGFRQVSIRVAHLQLLVPVLGGGVGAPADREHLLDDAHPEPAVALDQHARVPAAGHLLALPRRPREGLRSLHHGPHRQRVSGR